MTISDWLSNNWIEIFGAITGIIYVILEIRQNIWLWPVGITTSAVYIAVFFTSKFYADMSLQAYYLVISCAGWYWWMKGGRQQAVGRRQENEKGNGGEWYGNEGSGLRAQGSGQEVVKGRMGEGVIKGLRDGETEGLRDGGTEGLRDEETEGLRVTRLKLKTGVVLAMVFILLYFLMWLVLSKLTDSPVSEWDSFITSLSIIATWMLARKIYEHWFLWIIVNSASSVIFMVRGLYPTVILYLVYLVMSFVGLKEWKRSL